MRAVLTYHSIDPSGSPISVDRATFEGHLEWLASGATAVVPLETMVAGGGGDPAVALTFDDGFANLADGPMAGLTARGLPATVFVVSDQVGGTNAWGGREDPRVPTLPLLGWDGLGRLAEAGIAIGSHTRRHPRMPALSPAEVEDELAGSAERIARQLGHRPTAFAYPYGATSPAVVDQVRGHYRTAVTTEHRPIGAVEDHCLVPRLDAFYFRRPGALDQWNTRTFRRSVRLRRLARALRAGFESVRRRP